MKTMDAQAIEQFLKQYSEIVSKAESIASYPMLYERGQDLEGYEFDDYGITIKSSTHYSGCGRDSYSATISWHDLNEPIEFHAAENNKRLMQQAEYERQKPIREAKAKEEAERKLYEELRAKFH